MLEFKIVRVDYSKNNLLKSDKAFAIVVSTHLIAEPDARRGVYLAVPEDMFVIANDISDATFQLNSYLTQQYGRKK